MTKTFTGFLTVIALAVTLSFWPTVTAHAKSDKKPVASGISGRWTMSVDGGPHGATTMGLALEQDGTKVAGTFSSPHGDLPIEGEFVDGTLTLATTSGGDHSPQITFNGKLKDDGTLAGYLSSEMGDMTWTAERVKEKR